MGKKKERRMKEKKEERRDLVLIRKKEGKGLLIKEGENKEGGGMNDTRLSAWLPGFTRLICRQDRI